MLIKEMLALALALMLLVTSSCAVQVDVPSEETPPSNLPYSLMEPIQMDVDALCQGEGKVVDSVNFTLLTLPRWIRKSFQDTGWSIMVVDYDLATVDYAGYFAPGDVLGSTIYKDREIRILNEPKASVNAPIHEFGHWLDWILGYPTMSGEEYLRIYEEEQDAYMTHFGPACSWNEQEFLAEGFWCYWKSPEALRKVCPQLYQYLNDNLNMLKEQCTSGG